MNGEASRLLISFPPNSFCIPTTMHNLLFIHFPVLPVPFYCFYICQRAVMIFGKIQQSVIHPAPSLKKVTFTHYVLSGQCSALRTPAHKLVFCQQCNSGTNPWHTTPCTGRCYIYKGLDARLWIVGQSDKACCTRYDKTRGTRYARAGGTRYNISIWCIM